MDSWTHERGIFCHRLPINPSSLTRWRKRIGKDGMEQLLKLTIHAGQATKTITEANLQVVVVDTTVQPKAVAYPTDARLYLKVLHALVRIAKRHEIKSYGFGVRASLATTAQNGFVVGMMSCPGNPYDGHTLADQFDQVERLTGRMPERCHVDKGYKGHSAERCQVIISGSRRGITKTLKKEMPRRSSIEPEIGHQKADGKLGRNWLKGSQGDMINAVLCGVGANLRKILASA